MPTIVILVQHVERLFGQQLSKLGQRQEELSLITVSLQRKRPRRGDDQSRDYVVCRPAIEKDAEFMKKRFVSFDHRPTGTSR